MSNALMRLLDDDEIMSHLWSDRKPNWRKAWPKLYIFLHGIVEKYHRATSEPEEKTKELELEIKKMELELQFKAMDLLKYLFEERSKVNQALALAILKPEQLRTLEILDENQKQKEQTQMVLNSKNVSQLNGNTLSLALLDETQLGTLQILDGNKKQVTVVNAGSAQLKSASECPEVASLAAINSSVNALMVVGSEKCSTLETISTNYKCPPRGQEIEIVGSLSSKPSPPQEEEIETRDPPPQQRRPPGPPPSGPSLERKPPPPPPPPPLGGPRPQRRRPPPPPVAGKRSACLSKTVSPPRKRQKLDSNYEVKIQNLKSDYEVQIQNLKDNWRASRKQVLKQQKTIDEKDKLIIDLKQKLAAAYAEIERLKNRE